MTTSVSDNSRYGMVARKWPKYQALRRLRGRGGGGGGLEKK